jgi:hypothetical protein
MKTRNIVQIRSHAQKYLIKICKMYDIKLSKKKFLNKKSSHLDLSEKDKLREKLNPQNMNKYDRNILNMFKYYDRNYPNHVDSISIPNKNPTDENENTHLNNTKKESLSPIHLSKNFKNSKSIQNPLLISLLKLQYNNNIVIKNFITSFVELYSFSDKVNLLKILKGTEYSDEFYNFKCNIINNCINILKEIEGSYNISKIFLDDEKCTLHKQLLQYLIKVNENY